MKKEQDLEKFSPLLKVTQVTSGRTGPEPRPSPPKSHILSNIKPGLSRTSLKSKGIPQTQVKLKGIPMK